eukprot:RCo054523
MIVGHTAHGLLQPAQRAQLSGQPGPSKAVPVLHQRALQVGEGLRGELPQPLRVVQLNLSQHLLEKPQHIGHAIGQSLAVELHKADAVPWVPQLAGREGGRGDPPGEGADPALQLYKVPPSCTQLSEALREQRYQGDQPFGHGTQVEAHVQVDHPTGRQLVGKDLRSGGQLLHLPRNRAVLRLQILHSEKGDCRQRLRGVMGKLPRLQLRRVLDDLLELSLAEAVLVSVQGSPLFGLCPLSQGFAGHAEHRDTVRVVQEQPLQGALEHWLASGQAGADLLQGGLVPQPLQRISIIDPVGNRAEHPAQPSGVRARVLLP